MNEEERNKAYQFLQELDKNGYRYTADGRELYIIENVFHKIDKLQKELDKKDKVINLMAEDIRQVIGDDNYLEMTKEETIQKYFEKVEEENDI